MQLQCNTVGSSRKRTKRLNAELHLSFQQVDGPTVAMSGCRVNMVNVCVCVWGERFDSSIIAHRPRQTAPIKTKYHRRTDTGVGTEWRRCQAPDASQFRPPDWPVWAEELSGRDWRRAACGRRRRLDGPWSRFAAMPVPPFTIVGHHPLQSADEVWGLRKIRSTTRPQCRAETAQDWTWN